MSKGMEGGVSRRSFLKGAGVAAAAVAGSAALAGCATGSTGAASGDWMPKSWDYECDLLVIGYGGAGMWASLIGADECGQEVIVLEKAPERGGGNSSINNGEWTIVEENEKDRFAKYIKAFTHGKTPEPMIDAWVNECARNTEYADKYGMTYEVSEVALAGAIPEYYFLDDNAYEGSCKLSSVDGFGMLSFHELDAQREKLGVQVVFDCHDERLIQNPDTKEIVGAYTMIGSEEKTVKARKGVILCTGGFEFNEDMKRKYLKCYPFKFEGWKYNTGDGIKMVEEVGGKLWHMGMAGAMYGMWTRDPENDFLILIMPPDQTFIYTDRLGKRWVDEMRIGSPHNGWHAFTHFNDEICDYDHCPSWCVFDQTLFEAGPMSTRQGDWFECGNFTTMLPDELRDWEGWSDDKQAEVDKGWIIKADTIEELAAKMKEIDKWMDVGTLKATIDTWNQVCENGEDPEFHRSPATLNPLNNPPFYAYTVYPGSCSTLGGAMKNEHGQVLDVFAERPIPRLYGAGSFGNIHSHTYGITGGNVAENMIWGRISARHAASLDAWDEKK